MLAARYKTHCHCSACTDRRIPDADTSFNRSQTTTQAGLFTYIALLDLGVLALAYSKQWRSLNYMAFISTVLIFAAWMSEWYEPSKLWTTILFLTVLFAIFALLAVLYNVVNRRPTGWLDLAMGVLERVSVFRHQLRTSRRQPSRDSRAVCAAGVGFLHGPGYFTYDRDREDAC